MLAKGATEMDVMNKQDIMRFDIKMSFGGISHTATAPDLLSGMVSDITINEEHKHA